MITVEFKINFIIQYSILQIWSCRFDQICKIKTLSNFFDEINQIDSSKM